MMSAAQLSWWGTSFMAQATHIYWGKSNKGGDVLKNKQHSTMETAAIKKAREPPATSASEGSLCRHSRQDLVLIEEKDIWIVRMGG